VAAITVNPWFQAVPFDLVRDLAPVTQLTRAAFVLVVNPRNSMNSLDDMIAQAKKQPGKLNYGSFGIGSGSHLAMAMLEDAAGVSLTHVSYKGLAPMQLALLAGEIDVAFDTAVNVVRQVKAGRLRALAVTSPSEAEGLAGVPSLVSRYPDFNADGWQGVWVPAGTPRPVIERLQGEISAILKTPEIIQKFRELSSEPVGNSAKDFDTFVRAELARWGKLIREMNIKGE
jgi:tripartite-type tricarboxylate transporter receptor subunit TctC